MLQAGPVKEPMLFPQSPYFEHNRHGEISTVRNHQVSKLVTLCPNESDRKHALPRLGSDFSTSIGETSLSSFVLNVSAPPPSLRREDVLMAWPVGSKFPASTCGTNSKFCCPSRSTLSRAFSLSALAPVVKQQPFRRRTPRKTPCPRTLGVGISRVRNNILRIRHKTRPCATPHGT